MMPGAIVAIETRLGLKTARSFARFQAERAFNERSKANPDALHSGNLFYLRDRHARGISHA